MLKEIKLWLHWRKIPKEMTKMEKAGYDPKKSLKAGAWGFAQAAGGVMLTALIAFASDPEAVGAALSGMDGAAALKVATAGFIVFVARFLANKRKHK